MLKSSMPHVMTGRGTKNTNKYNQTCIKRPPKESLKSGVLIQVVF